MIIGVPPRFYVPIDDHHSRCVSDSGEHLSSNWNGGEFSLISGKSGSRAGMKMPFTIMNRRIEIHVWKSIITPASQAPLPRYWARNMTTWSRARDK